MISRYHSGNTAQRPPDGFVAHLPLIFSGILHTNSLTYVSMPAKFMHNLPKNLTAHLHHNLCAVLPKEVTFVTAIMTFGIL